MEMAFAHRPDDPHPADDIGLLAQDLRRVLRTELLRDTCYADSVARLFSMHRRTMNRHLNAEGLSFRKVANETRFEIACELLANTDMGLNQIAAVLRYSELSAFTRAFRRWSGQTPSAWRNDHLQGREAPRPRDPRRLRAAPRRRPSRTSDPPDMATRPVAGGGP
ncbi:helix-turn-helix domain-containing protein [Microvirga sesbaniae]|uniref:helix-turn-helix domain-containing protein n=1 Tax=Microvirga sesbaniae TaxID=681392 RepID=UPI0021C7495F|nr:AraC family transcriptional regulator [Microvirga sp. HBU67692]